MDALLTPSEHNLYLYVQDNLFNRVFVESPDVLPSAVMRFFHEDTTLLELTLANDGLLVVSQSPFLLTPRNLTDDEKLQLKASSDFDCRYDFKTGDKTYHAGKFVQTTDALACESTVRFRLELRGPVGLQGEQGVQGESGHPGEVTLLQLTQAIETHTQTLDPHPQYIDENELVLEVTPTQDYVLWLENQLS